MTVRYQVCPVAADADRWAVLLFGRSGKRAERLSRMRGIRLAQSMTAEALCRDLLAELDPGAPFTPEDDDVGRPFLPGQPYFISLSHSGGYAAAAAADVPVGIDLQELRDVSDRTLRRFYSPAEQCWIGAGDRRSRSIRLWTMKEAYGKLLGTGILGGSRFSATFSGDRPETGYDGVRFLFPDAPEGLIFTVCLAERSES